MIDEIPYIEQLAVLIRDIGYRAKVLDSESISTAMSGWNIVVLAWPNHSIQMFFGISREPETTFDAESANNYNKINRFVKCYVSDKGISFEGDFHFMVTQPDAKERLEQIFSSWEISVDRAQKAVR